MDLDNRRIDELQNLFGNRLRRFRERIAAAMRRMDIQRVFSTFDDIDPDGAPDALVGARLHPRRPLGGSAIALPEPEEDLTTEAIGSGRR